MAIVAEVAVDEAGWMKRDAQRGEKGKGKEA